MNRAAVFSEWYGVGPVAGRICAALYVADTQPLTVAELRDQLGHAHLTTRSALIRLRLVLEPGEMVSDGLRYALTDAGMDDCNAALADARSRGIAA